ncbi:MAG: LemA family protein [Planctomycetota bacterium]
MIYVVIAAVLLPLVFVIANYNRLVTVRSHLRESWADIDVEMKRRYELIPNLVEVVKGYAQHEREVLAEVVRLRNQAAASVGSATQQAVDEQALTVGVEKLLAVAEAYPNLKADTHYLALQRELAVTEDRIAAARRFYNGNVRELNELCQAFPTNVIAGMFGFQRADYFDAGEMARQAPRVGL